MTPNKAFNRSRRHRVVAKRKSLGGGPVNLVVRRSKFQSAVALKDYDT